MLACTRLWSQSLARQGVRVGKHLTSKAEVGEVVSLTFRLTSPQDPDTPKGNCKSFSTQSDAWGVSRLERLPRPVAQPPKHSPTAARTQVSDP